ncbi:MAG TPA: response regulator [Vicinamibacterales bacterium]|nr:response regulator [Vicinamibacterales bacterium]
MTQILVVTTSPATSEAVVNLLKSQGYGVSSVCGFQAAVQALDAHAPEFLISDLRLGAFNALHLAIRHRQDHPRMQTIVLDCVHDPGIERDAVRQGALYLVEPIDASDLLDQISARLAQDGPPRRWPRRVPERALHADAAHERARIVDLSYGGVRLEAAEGVEFPPAFDLFCAEMSAPVRVNTVWTRPASRGWTWCGAEVCEKDPVRLASWRRVVDSAARAENGSSSNRT